MVRMGMALRTRLGDQPASELVDFVEARESAWRDDVIDQLEPRLRTLATREDLTVITSVLRQEMVAGFSQLRKEMTDQRVELLRWSFLFWIGQVAATAGLISLALRFGEQ
jgi:hypothetical protein